MKAYISMIVLCIIMISVGGNTQDEIPRTTIMINNSGDSQIKIETNIYQILTHISGDTSLTENIFNETEPDKLTSKQVNVTYFTEAELKFGNTSLEADAKEWKWEEEPSSISKGIRKYVSPSFLISSGHAFRLTTQNEVEYAVYHTNGLYQIKTHEQKSGLLFGGQADLLENSMVKLHIDPLEIATVKDREKLTRTRLNIGYPSFHISKFVTTVYLKLGEYCGFMVSTEGNGTWMLQLKVELVKPE